MILAFLLAVSAFSSQPASAVAVISSVPADKLGYCKAGEMVYDLNEVMFVENEHLTFGEKGRRYKISVDRESVIIERVKPIEASSLVRIKVDNEVSESEDIDIELKLALVNGKLAIYWRETFRNKIYQQGLLKVVGQGLSPLCEGRGGISSSH